MRKALKIIVIVIAVLVLVIILIPFAFKGKIIQTVKTQANKSVNATVDFRHIGISIFKNFPDLTVTLDQVTIAGKGAFERDTLAKVRELRLTIDLGSIFRGDYGVKKLIVNDPDIKVRVLEDGRANYDIALPEEETAATETATPGESPISFELKSIVINGLKLLYDDASLGLFLRIDRVDNEVRGKMYGDVTTLNTETAITGLTLKYEGIEYLKNTKATYKAGIEADLGKSKYTLKENELIVNEFPVRFDGYVAMPGEDIELDFTFSSPGAMLKSLLSLVPAIYAKDFEGLKADGRFSFDGFAKGIYNEKSMPGFGVNLLVENGMFGYPGLPDEVRDIQIRCGITNPDGDPDHTIVNIEKFSLNIGKNPVDIRMIVKTPVSDPDIDGHIRAMFDLGSVGRFYPLDAGDELAGTLSSDVTLKGRLSSVENERYSEFQASGTLKVNDVRYKTALVPERIEIRNMHLNFSPAFLELTGFAMTVGKNDFGASGKLENYLDYLFSDGVIKGNLTTTSNYFDVSSMMPETVQTAANTSAQPPPPAPGVLVIPANIDFTMKSTFRKLIYDSIPMENVEGVIRIIDGKVSLDRLGMNILGGSMTMTGSYKAENQQKAFFDFIIDIREIELRDAYNTFGVMYGYFPIAGKAAGKFSTKFNLKSDLDGNMMPVYPSLNGAGLLSSTKLTLANINTLDKMADALKFDRLKTLAIEKMLIDFEFVNGKLVVEPFDVKVEDMTMKIGGSTGIDQTIDYVMDLAIPRAKFGQAANNVLNNLVSEAKGKGVDISLGDMVNLAVLVGGTLANPEVRTNLKQAGSNIVEELKSKAIEEIEKKKEELITQGKEEAQKILAEADKNAQALISEAGKQAENIRKTARDAAAKIKEEAYKKAGDLEAEGKKNGFLAEKAAKESAKKIRSEADKKAGDMVAAGDKEAENVMKKAREEADKIRNDAKAKVK